MYVPLAQTRSMDVLADRTLTVNAAPGERATVERGDAAPVRSGPTGLRHAGRVLRTRRCLPRRVLRAGRVTVDSRERELLAQFVGVTGIDTRAEGPALAQRRKTRIRAGAVSACSEGRLEILVSARGRRCCLALPPGQFITGTSLLVTAPLCDRHESLSYQRGLAAGFVVRGVRRSRFRSPG